MKRDPVEAGCVNARHGRNGAQASAARRQERIVACQGLDMILRRSRQRRAHGLLVPGVGLMPVVGGPPQEHRDLNRSEAGAVKGEAERGRGGCDGADSPIRLPRIRRWLGRLRNGMDPRFRQRGAKIMLGICRTVWVDPAEIRYSARFDEHSEAAIRESEGTDALRIDVCMSLPVRQHEIDQPAQLGGPAP